MGREVKKKSKITGSELANLTMDFEEQGEGRSRKKRVLNKCERGRRRNSREGTQLGTLSRRTLRRVVKVLLLLSAWLGGASREIKPLENHG